MIPLRPERFAGCYRFSAHWGRVLPVRVRISVGKKAGAATATQNGWGKGTPEP